MPPPRTRTARFARARCADPWAHLIAIATRHLQRSPLPLSSRSLLADGLETLLEGDEREARRLVMLSVFYSIGASHDDYAAAHRYSRQIEQLAHEVAA